jgi:hypothetical protein
MLLGLAVVVVMKVSDEVPLLLVDAVRFPGLR